MSHFRLHLGRGAPPPPPPPPGTLTAPALGYPSPLASNPTTIVIHIPVDWIAGDVFKLPRSAAASITSPTILTHTITDADIIAGTTSIGLSSVTLAGITYFQGYGSRGGVDSSNLSGVVAWGDTTAPVITTSATPAHIFETLQLALPLTATDTGGVPALISDGTSPGWYISGGADQLQFRVALITGVPNLEWVGNGWQNYLSPNNSTLDSTQPYVVQVSAVDYGGNQTAKTISQYVDAIDQTPDAFTFTAVSGAGFSTVYTSNTVTLSGLQATFNIPASLSGTGFTYAKNIGSGGTYQAPGSFTVQNGDTLTLKDTSGSTNDVTNVCTVTVGTYSTNWSVSTPGSNFLLNSTFANTSTWTLGAGCSISGGVCNATAAGAICQQPITTWVSGGTYQVDLDYTCTSGSKLRINQDVSNGANIRVTSGALTVDGASHHLTLTFTSNVTSDYISLEADTAAFTGTIDNFTCVRTA